MHRNRRFYLVGTLILIGAIGHIMWLFVGGVPEEGHPDYLFARTAFFLSLIELLGFVLLGSLLWSVWRRELKVGIFYAVIWIVLYFLLLAIFLGISQHPLGLTIWMLFYLLIGWA